MLRIKRVVIQGFKTFARQTEFVFDPGVTAIVGPNGSGKSNVADAVRWCLGEQSFGLLRSKKTADVIFSGSEKRARLGMAMVSLVLDNSNGELPIDFSEVEIARRAYRDGDNEYLINGQRVRLQDVTQLLAPSGLGKRTYAVIGQGLIDRVLSLKPEERRTLFEEAAGITGYQQKRTTAMRRLEATQQNLERAQDILTELSPRLRYLKRQADRAREREQVETDLKGLLHTWYGYRWHRTLRELRSARETAQRDEQTTQARRARLQAIGQEIESLRTRQTDLRTKLNERHLVSSAQHQEAEEVSRRHAVAQERHRQTVARQEELERELTELRLERDTVQSRLASLRGEVEEAQREQQSRQAAVDRAQSQLSLRQQDQNTQQQRLQAAESALRKLEARITDRRSRLAQLNERRETLNRTLADLADQLAQAEEQLAQREQALATAAQNEQEQRLRLEAIQAQAAADTAALSQLQNSLQAQDQKRQEADRAVDRLQTRLDLLQRLRREGAGYASGVRSVLQADQSGELDGILGTVASRLHVPAHLEKAVEVALGGAFQNVIVRTWQDAQRAIEYLKRSAGGRATFLPLDRLRVGKGIPAPRRNGILGNGVDLVSFHPDVAPAMQQLLNRVWIAEDLTGARQALDNHPGPVPTVVTLTGEIVRPGGAVTGGEDARRQHDSILAREREVRELPEQLSQAQAEAKQAATACQQLRQQIERQRQQITTIEEERTVLQRSVRQSQTALEQARLAVAQAKQAAEWQTRLLAESQEALTQLLPQEETFQQELEQALTSHQQAKEQATQAAAAVQSSRLDDLLHELADLRAAAAEASGQLQSRRTILTDQRRALEAIESQFQSKSQRLANLQQAAQQLQKELDEITATEQSLGANIAGLRREIEPLEKELHKLEAEQAQAESDERQIQQLLRQDETAWNSSQLNLQRTEDRLENLRREIRQDFGLAEMEEAEELAYQPPLPLQAVVAQLPVVEQLPPGLDEEVRETRARLRRLSNVNPEAPKEYEQAAERHEFLLNQSADLEQAAKDLRRVIRELDQRMEEELRTTFAAVSREFVQFFKLLFQGGTAQLSMTEPEDVINTGIEILARPPGKRPQSLELLSGGERSLTACALIFAILRVSPTPFCVLDEVDAALDEANVDRFRTVLETLGGQTQFILITHNRRTLEASNAIYGITMGDDGVSRVISLRLEGDEMVETDAPTPESEPVVAM